MIRMTIFVLAMVAIFTQNINAQTTGGNTLPAEYHLEDVSITPADGASIEAKASWNSPDQVMVTYKFFNDHESNVVLFQEHGATLHVGTTSSLYRWENDPVTMTLTPVLVDAGLSDSYDVAPESSRTRITDLEIPQDEPGLYMVVVTLDITGFVAGDGFTTTDTYYESQDAIISSFTVTPRN